MFANRSPNNVHRSRGEATHTRESTVKRLSCVETLVARGRSKHDRPMGQGLSALELVSVLYFSNG